MEEKKGQNITNKDQDGSNPPEHLICIICYEIFLYPITISCGHTFCKTCLEKAIQIKPACPSCRAPCLGSVEYMFENISLKNIIETEYNKQLQERKTKSSPPKPPKPNTASFQIEVQRNQLALLVSRQSDYLFPGSKSIIEIEFQGNYMHLQILLPTRVCIFVNKYAENEIASQCHIIRQVNPSSSVFTKNTTRVKLLVKVLQRVKLVNIKTVNAAENPIFSRTMLGNARDEFLVTCVDCQVFKDNEIEGSLDGFETRVDGMVAKIQVLLEKLKQNNYLYYNKLRDFRAIEYFESNEHMRNTPSYYSNVSLSIANILKMEKQDKIKAFVSDDISERLRITEAFLEHVTEVTEPTVILGFNDWDSFNFDKMLFFLIVFGFLGFILFKMVNNF